MNRRRAALWLLALNACLVSRLEGQEPDPKDTTPAPVKADLNDVETIDGLIAALYDVISGPKGAARDWARLKSLFHPQARLVPVVHPRDQAAESRVYTLDQFIEIAGPAFENDGFYESEVARKTEQFAHIAHVFSTYEVRRARDEEPFIRGINSIQLLHDGTRWWVLTIAWDTERQGEPIPDAYLPES